MNFGLKSFGRIIICKGGMLVEFNEEDKYWIEKCKEEPNTYRIVIDVNTIYVVNMNIDKALYNFRGNGIVFAQQLLNYIGCSSEFI